MDFTCKAQKSCMKSLCAYCCSYRRELLKNNNFEKNIEITPRVIICKSLEKCGTYYQAVEIRNTGTLTRPMKFYTEPNTDVSFKIKGSTELIAGGSVTVEIYVEPSKKKDINRHRFFYALAEHPDIVFEVPIIVMKIPPELFIPSLLCLHKVPPNTATHYQFILYNPFECDLPFTTCSTYENISFSLTEGVMQARNFSQILLTAKVPSQAGTVSLVVTVNGKCHPILVHMEPSDRIIFLSNPVISFGDTYMGIKVQKSIHICNKSKEDVSFQWTTSLDPPPSDVPTASEELAISDFITIKNRRGCLSGLNSALSIITLSPPTKGFPEEEEPPYKTNITIYLCCPLIKSKYYKLQITGSILGPDIDITPRSCDVGNIYLGQVKCLTLNVINQGPIKGEVYVKEYTDETDIRCIITPQSITVQPDETETLNVRFYRRNLGKFLTKITFKVRCGNIIPVLLRGNSIGAKVKIWPDSFELTDIPICVPQKRFALIANPLPVSIVVEPLVLNEGLDDPLILCVDYSKFPLHTRPTPYVNAYKRTTEDELEDAEIRPRYSDFELNKKFDLLEATKSNLSWLFEDKVLDQIPEMADELLKSIKILKPQFQPEPGLKLIDAALDCLLNRSDYFDELKVKQNFMNMNWTSLPENPKEIAIETERFYLKPNESKSFPVILIPNITGPNHRTIQFRACPLAMDQSDIKTAIKSSHMLEVLQLQYKCVVPDLVFKSEVKLHNPIYVDKLYEFRMRFKNNNTAPGFAYFNILPKTNTGILQVAKSQRKFLIQSGETVTVTASATFRKTGNVSLTGSFQMVGKASGSPFTVSAEVLPPKVCITPEKLIQKQMVLNCVRARLFIENISSTIAKFTVSLKSDKCHILEPRGGHLAPGQKILISVFSKFLDPGIYKNVIILNMVHTEKIFIPAQFIVEGTPLIFEPNIKNGFDCGTLFRSEKIHEFPVTITNDGEKTYRVLFIKQKPKGNIAPPIVFDIQPSGLALKPRGTDVIKILLDTSKEVTVEELYFVDGMGEDNTRYKFFHFACKCEVIQSKVVWSKPYIRLESGCDYESADRIFDTVALINSTPLNINVNLLTCGCFSLIDASTNTANKTLNFKLEGKGMKQFVVKLSSNEIDSYDVCQCFQGFVKCKANGKLQKGLGLFAKIINPGIRIVNPNITFFTQNLNAYAHISLQNDGSLPARFYWKPVSSEFKAISIDENYERICAKTISETILGLPDDLIPVIPINVYTSPEVCFSDAEHSDVGDEEYDDAIMLEAESIKPSLSINTSSKQKSSNLEGSKKSLSATKSRSSEKTKSSEKSKASPNLKSKSSDSLKKDSESQKGLDSAKKQPLVIEVIEPPPKPPFVCKKPLVPLSSASAISSDGIKIEIDQILEYLGLPRSKPKKRGIDFQDSPRTDSSQFNKYIYDNEETSAVNFQERNGVILPKTLYKSYCFLPCVPQGLSLVQTFDLEVEGGETRPLELKVTSLKGRIKISHTNIDISRQVWYKTLYYKIELNNPCPFAVKIKIVETKDKGDLATQLLNGTVVVHSSKSFLLMPEEKSLLDCHVLLGLRYNFIEDIGVEVNNSTTGIPIRFHGAGLMPMILPKTLSNMTRKSLDTIASYLTMGSIYDNVRKKNKSKLGFQKSGKDDSNNGESYISKSLTITGEEEFDPFNVAPRRRPHNFVALRYSDEIGPRALEIERLIETWKFIAELKDCERLKQRFHQYYCKCMLIDADEFDTVVNLKLTICRPVPWEVSAYVLNMGDILVNETKNYKIELTFLGPGKVFLSARTRIVIPGLTAWFDDCYSVNYPNSFVFYLQSPDESKQKLYRNKSERNTDELSEQDEVKIDHAHSFDFDANAVHRREKAIIDAAKIKERYNKISYPQKIVKNPLILAEICQVGDEDWHNSTFNLTILFTALGGCFEITQVIDDYLLIDVHLGPTLPIQLQGRVTNMKSTDL